MKMLTKFAAVFTAIVFFAVTAFPALAQEVVRITIETNTTITIDGSMPVLEIQGRPLGVKYFYDNAEQRGDGWIAWNNGENIMREGEIQTKCWPSTRVDTGKRGHVCATYLDGMPRF